MREEKAYSETMDIDQREWGQYLNVPISVLQTEAGRFYQIETRFLWGKQDKKEITKKHLKDLKQIIWINKGGTK